MMEGSCVPITSPSTGITRGSSGVPAFAAHGCRKRAVRTTALNPKVPEPNRIMNKRPSLAPRYTPRKRLLQTKILISLPFWSADLRRTICWSPVSPANPIHIGSQAVNPAQSPSLGVWSPLKLVLSVNACQRTVTIAHLPVSSKIPSASKHQRSMHQQVEPNCRQQRAVSAVRR